MKRARKKRSSRFTPDLAIKKVTESSKLAEYRDGVKQHQRRRIKYAFQLLQGMYPDQAQRTERYRTLLKLAEKKGGRELVAAIAGAVGMAKFANMKESDRLQLPSELAKHEGCYKLDVFQTLAQECWDEAVLPSSSSSGSAQLHRPGTDHFQELPFQTAQSLTGDVYKLTQEDTVNILMAATIGGSIFLTNTYDMETPPFITVPISRELSAQYAAEREQVM